MFLKRAENRKVAPVAKSWERLDKWYQTHLPEVFESLRPPATIARIKKFEKAIGLKIPEDWRESLLIHDGQIDDVGTGAMGGLPLEPLDGVLNNLQFWRRLIEEGFDLPDDDATTYPEHAIKNQHLNANWIPLDSWDGNCWGIDLDPGPTGVMGQIINFGRDCFKKYVLALSLAQFLEDMADEMEAGNLTVERFAIDSSGKRAAEPGKKGSWRCNFGPPESHLCEYWAAPSLANYEAQWAKAKLPERFKKATPGRALRRKRSSSQ